MDHYCEGCEHFYSYYLVNRCCNYIFDTGHKRPCPPGQGCTVKKPRRSVGAVAVEKSTEKSGYCPQKQEEV